MHGWNDSTERLAREVVDLALARMRMDPPLDHAKTYDQLWQAVGQTVTPSGLGGHEALRRFDQELALACISTDHPRFLAFIPGAPAEAASLFDLYVSAASVYGGSWMEGSGAVYAENQALGWLAGLAGYPESAGGVFVSGGTNGNLSALVAAREYAKFKRGGDNPRRWYVIASDEAHSSIQHAARVMDLEILDVPVPADGPEAGRLTGAAVRAALATLDPQDAAFAIVSSSGTTNYGVVDDISSLADVADEFDLWLHVDGAYGGAGLAAPSVRHLYNGIERSDSFIVDPHKWLFAPYDACALVYREPRLARAAHNQKAGYLDAIQSETDWNPSDYAVHLSRRARGLPLWFALATHGTDAFTASIEQTIDVARYVESEVTRRDEFELVRHRDLSVVVFRRLGWSPEDYSNWSDHMLDAGEAFVTPTKHRAETVTRVAIVNPRTTTVDIDFVLDSMAAWQPGTPRS
jgi:L-2,4-diaminobutyrate decarboxylase